MKKPLTILALAGISCASLLISQPSFAQLLSTDQNTDPLARPNAGDLNWIDLMHRANLGTLEWNPDQQRLNIDSETSNFRARQQQRLEEQQQSQKNTPASSEEETQVQ
jgi:hypothetical protein